MVTVGFEIEFTDFKVNLGPNPYLKGTDLFIIRDALNQGRKVFRVTPDNYDAVRRRYACLEVITSDPIEDVNLLNFAPLDLFIDTLKQIIASSKNWTVTLDARLFAQSTLKNYCDYVYDGSVTISFEPERFTRLSPSALRDVPCLVSLQMTFGFPVDSLRKFYQYFRVEQYSGDSTYRLTFTIGHQPYSLNSIILYYKIMSAKRIDDLLTSDQLGQLLPILELVKTYIAYATSTCVNETQVNEQDWGYKAYCNCIMSRTAFSSMLQSLSIEFSAPLQSAIKTYIKECFPSNITLFPCLYTQGTIGRPPKKYMIEEDIQNITREALTLDNILNSLFTTIKDPQFELYYSSSNSTIKVCRTSDIQHNIIDKMLDLFNEEMLAMAVSAAVQHSEWRAYLQEQLEINNNALVYDLFSPVPLSPSEDPMGRYSRPPYNRDKPLIEVRRMNNLFLSSNFVRQQWKEIEQFIEQSQVDTTDDRRKTQGNLFYSNALKYFIQHQCEEAINDWPSAIEEIPLSEVNLV